MADRSRDAGATQTPESFEDFFNNAPAGLLVLSPDGDVLRANKCFAEWVSCDPQSLTGQRFSDCLTVSGRIYYDTHLGPLLRMQGFFSEIALELALPDGKRVPVLANAAEKRTEDGRPILVRLTVFRATERRHYERELLVARNELRALSLTLEERIADEVSRRLGAEGKLSEERRMAKLREQFIAVLGHDLRNPLASIRAGINLLARTISGPKEAKIATLMQASVMRMTGLIDDITDFARARLGGGFVLKRKLTALEPVLQNVVDELRAASPERTIHTEFDLKRPINCDPDRVAQLLSNLVANAITHGAPDSPVSIGAFNENGLLELHVINLGDEIPSYIVERLFKPFARGNLDSSSKGLGLGLYIASQIARAHGGELSAKSSPQETRFVLRMPAD